MAIDNKQIALDVLAAIGGKDNITSVTHCMTRLRFNLKDLSIPDREQIKTIKGVLGVVESGGQFQVIIGQNVPKVYEQVCALTGLQSRAPVPENLDKPKEKLTPKKIGNNILNYMAGCMTPLIPVMMASAMFKTLMVILGPDMLGLFGAESDVYILLDFLYDAFYYFIPIFLGYTAAVKLGLTPGLGMYAGAILLVPDFVALVGNVESFKIYGLFNAPLINYGQSVLPAVLSVWVLSYIYKFFQKIIPDTLSTIFTPFLSMIVLVPIEFCLLAPLGSICGDYLGAGMIAFGEFGGVIAVAMVAALWEYLVMSGMHVVLVTFAITTLMNVGVDFFVSPAATCATWSAIGIALGAFLRLKNKDEKALSFGYFISGILGGVTEPALYGVGFKYKRPFIAMSIGGALGGLYAGIAGVDVYVVGASNFLNVLGYVAGGTTNLINGIISCLIAMLGAAVATYFFGFSKATIDPQ